MDLLPRQRRIFEILLQSRDKYVSSNTIADYVGVTNKTVQSDIVSLSNELEAYNVEILSYRGKGYQLKFWGDDELNLINIINSFRQQSFKNIDVSMFVCKLLLTPLYTTQQEMMDLILCGVGQLKEILSKAVHELSRHKLNVKSVPGSGFIVNGPELARRFAFIYHLRVLEENPSFYTHFIENTHYMDKMIEFEDVDAIIQSLWAQGLVINEKNKSILYKYLNYSRFRTQSDQAVMSMRHEFPIFRNHGFDESNIPISNLNFNVIEKRYFNIAIQFLINESSFIGRSDNLNFSKIENNVVGLINQFFNRRPNLFNDTFYDIPRLQREVTKTIIFIVRKNMVGFREYQVNQVEMNRSDENIIAVEFASLLAFKIENDLKLEFFQEDIIRLAMIFNIHFYNDLWTKYKRVVLYSDNSLTAAKFLKRKLRSELPNIKVSVGNYHSLKSMKIEDSVTLFVVEKGSIPPDHSHYLTLQSFSSINEISQYIKNYILESDEKNQSFFNLFSKKRFHKDMLFYRRNEVVSWICDLYDVDEERKNVIQHNVFVREMRYLSTVFGRAAYPKIYVDSIDHPQFEVVTLKEPMLWGGKEVDVLLIAMLPNTYTSLNLLGKPLNELRINLNLIQMVHKVDSYEAFIDLLKDNLQGRS